MSLIKCPECGKKISDKSDVCVHCGAPIKKIKDQENISKQNKKTLSFLQKIIIILFVIGLIGSIFGEKDKPTTADNSSTTSDEQLKQQVIRATEKTCNQKKFGPEIQKIVPGLQPDRKAYCKCFGELYAEAMMILPPEGTNAESAKRIVFLLSSLCLGIQNGDYSSVEKINSKLPSVVKVAQEETDLITMLYKAKDIYSVSTQTDLSKNNKKSTDETSSGLAKVYYQSGKLYMEYGQKNGNIIGPYRVYYENGQLEHETNEYEPSKTQLIEKHYYKDGTIKSELKCSDPFNGTKKEYSSAGKLQKETKCMGKCTGNKNRDYTYCDSNDNCKYGCSWDCSVKEYEGNGKVSDQYMDGRYQICQAFTRADDIKKLEKKKKKEAAEREVLKK